MRHQPLTHKIRVILTSELVVFQIESIFLNNYMHVYKMMLTMTYVLTMKALYIITKTKQKGCLFWQGSIQKYMHF